MKKKTIIVFNWKMFPETKKKAMSIFSHVKKISHTSGDEHIEFIVAPPAVFLDSLVLDNTEKKIQFSGQDMHYQKSGAFTGAVSGSMLKDLGASYVITGHCERRKNFGESNEDVALKVRATIDRKMKAIVCIGEEVRDGKGNFIDFLDKQIIESLAKVGRLEAPKVIIAYEPVWAVGQKGRKVTLEDLEQSVFLIKKILKKKFGDLSDKVQIIYGGSVDDGNARSLLKVFGVNGFLLGRASLDYRVFSKIVKNLEKN